MFIKNFNGFLLDLNNNPPTDEWYMANFVEQHIKTLTTSEAFDNLKIFSSYMIEQYQPNSEYEMVETLRYLKIQADTNEIFCTAKQREQIFKMYRQEHSQNTLIQIF